MKNKCWYLYILRCNNGNLYTGISTDVKRRLLEHSKGGKKGAKCLRGKGPLLLVLKKKIGSLSLALRMEYKFKNLSKIKKELMIADQLTDPQF